jgi:hypothetical protein
MSGFNTVTIDSMFNLLRPLVLAILRVARIALPWLDVTPHTQVTAVMPLVIFLLLTGVCFNPVLADNQPRKVAQLSTTTIRPLPGQPGRSNGAQRPQTSSPFPPLAGAFRFIYAQMDYDRSLSFPEVDYFPDVKDSRFIQSFVPPERNNAAGRNDTADDCARYGGFTNAAYTYDQALVLLALLARGDHDGRERARLLANAFIEAKDHDPGFHGSDKEGQLRNGYRSGKLLNGGYIRIPYGQNPSQQDEEVEDQISAGTDTGAIAWAALALVQAHLMLERHQGKRVYLDAALALGNWIIIHTRVDDQRTGGFDAGMHGFPPPRNQFRETQRSTRYNIDIAVLFDHFAVIDNDNAITWKKQAENARSFVYRMRANGGEQYYRIGTKATGDNSHSNIVVGSPVTLDVQTSIVLQSRDHNPSADDVDAFNWALKNCTGSTKDTYDYNCKDHDGAWFEGMAKVVVALHWLSRDNDAKLILDKLHDAQLKVGSAAGAMPAASKCGLTTGLALVFRPSGITLPWNISNWPHIGTTAWFIFAELGKNPYYLAMAD